MKICLYKLKHIWLLEVFETVSERDVQVLVAGLTKVYRKDTPLIVDLEKATLEGKVPAVMDVVIVNLYKNGFKMVWVSNKLRGAHVDSLRKALLQMKVPAHSSIIEMVKQEAALRALKAREAELKVQLGDYSQKEENHKKMVAENKKLEWIVKIVEESIKTDSELNRNFSSRMNVLTEPKVEESGGKRARRDPKKDGLKDKVDVTLEARLELAAMKKSIVEYMNSKGVALGKRKAE